MMSASVFQAGGREFSRFYSVELGFFFHLVPFLVITTGKITVKALFYLY